MAAIDTAWVAGKLDTETDGVPVMETEVCGFETVIVPDTGWVAGKLLTVTGTAAWSVANTTEVDAVEAFAPRVAGS